MITTEIATSGIYTLYNTRNSLIACNEDAFISIREPLSLSLSTSFARKEFVNHCVDRFVDVTSCQKFHTFVFFCTYSEFAIFFVQINCQITLDQILEYLNFYNFRKVVSFFSCRLRSQDFLLNIHVSSIYHSSCTFY